MKIYLLIKESVYDFEKSCEYKAFSSYSDALAEYLKIRDSIVKEANELEYSCEEANNSIEAFQEEFYAQNHISLEKIEIYVN